MLLVFSNEYHAPSSALRSGTVIKRLAEIKQAEALERCDQAVAESCVQFLKLCELKWPNEVSAVALRNITDRKRLPRMLLVFMVTVTSTMHLHQLSDLVLLPTDLPK